MIQQRALLLSKVYYSAVCSSCGGLCEEAETIQAAHDLAVSAGWKFRTIWPGGEKVEVYTCQECRYNEPIRASPLDPDCELSDADPGL